MTCIIIDDEPLAVKLLESFVAKTPDLELLASFTDSIEAVGYMKQHPADLLLLDIQMPDLNGMELARMIPEQTKLVFTTAFKEYAYESYEVNAVDYLLKPIRYNKFLAAVEKVREYVNRMKYSRYGGTGVRGTRIEEEDSTDKTILAPRTHVPRIPDKTIPSSHSAYAFLRIDGELRRVDFDSILYVEGMKDYVMFYLDGERRPLVTHMTMKAVEDLLPSDRFMRVNRSYVVALDKIRKIDRNNCLYIGTEIIRVTDSYRDAFSQFVSQN